MTQPNDDLPARAAYQAACDARGVKPNWGAGGYPAQAARWRAIAAAALDPVEPVPRDPTPKNAVTAVARDLSDLRIPMSQAIAALVRAFDVAEEDRSRFVGNIKHYQRNGFPAGMEVRGRGAPAILGREQLLQLAVCETLHRSGTMPIPAMRLTMLAWDEVHRHLSSLLSDDERRHSLLVVWSGGGGSERIGVHGLEVLADLAGTDDLRSVSLHRLDTLAFRLRDAVRALDTVAPA